MNIWEGVRVPKELNGQDHQLDLQLSLKEEWVHFTEEDRCLGQVEEVEEEDSVVGGEDGEEGDLVGGEETTTELQDQ